MAGNLAMRFHDGVLALAVLAVTAAMLRAWVKIVPPRVKLAYVGPSPRAGSILPSEYSTTR